MKSIFKYSINTAPVCRITGPITKILCADEQYGEIRVWAEVDTETKNREYEVVVVGTGWDVEMFSRNNLETIFDTHDYIGTVKLEEGRLVFHVYVVELIDNKIKTRQPQTVDHLDTLLDI
jgi:hypothetical protein